MFAPVSDRSTLWFAIGIMALGMTFIPIGDGIAKHIQNTTDYNPVFLSWSRFLLGALIIVPWVLFTRQLPAPTRKHQNFWAKQCLRGVLIAATVTLIVIAVGLSPIADVFGAFFIGPGISVILAQWFLKAKASRFDWAAVLLGFIGVLLVVQPTGHISPGIPWALASGCCYGSFLVATRWAAGSGSPMAQLAAQLTVSTLCLTPLALPELLTHGQLMPGWVLMSAFLSGAANLFSIMALSKVDNAMLAPIVYMQLVSATLVGLVVFNDTPNQFTAMGLSLILATGLLKAFLAGRPTS